MAVKLTLAKKYTRVSNSVYKNIKPEFFGTKKDGRLNHRRYFPIELTPEEETAAISKSKAASRIKQVLSAAGYDLTDYIKGYAQFTKSDKPKKQNLRIGKILSGLGETSLLELFKTDPVRNIQNLMVVVSRHPYDLVGMSTNRGWVSCMSEDSSNFAYVKADVHGGTIVSYLIKKSDTNIKDPLARRLFKRYESDSGHVYYKPAAKAYGISNEYYGITCEKIEKVLNTDAPEGIYKFPDHFYYNDNEASMVDTRTPETMRKAALREHLKRLAEVANRLKPFMEAFESMSKKTKTPFDYSNFTGFVHEKALSGEISNDEYTDFFAKRATAFRDGTPMTYIPTIKNKIYSLENVDKITKDSVFLTFLNDIDTSDPTPFLEMVDALEDNEDYYKVMRRLNTGYIYPIYESGYRDRVGNPDMYDFNKALDLAAKCLFKLMPNIESRSSGAESKMILSNLSEIIKNTKSRNKKLEYYIMFGLKDNNVREQMIRQYFYGRSDVAAEMDSLTKGDRIPEHERAFVRQFIRSYNGYPVSDTYTIKDGVAKHSEEAGIELKECGYIF